MVVSQCHERCYVFSFHSLKATSFIESSHTLHWRPLCNFCVKVSKPLGSCSSSSVTETTSTSSELLEGESSVRGMLNQRNSGMFLNCNVNANVNYKE